MKNNLVYRSNIFNINVRPYYFSIVCTKGCSILIKEKKKKEGIVLPKDTIAFVERHLDLEVRITHKNGDDMYVVHTLNEHELNRLITILTPDIRAGIQQISGERKLDSKIHIVSRKGVNKLLFDHFKESDNHVSDIYNLAYIISKSKQLEKIYWSLCVSASRFFSDRVRDLLESDLSKKWRLSYVSEAFCMSEISVRKKLEAENTNFYHVLLDCRMAKAARLILDENNHINKITTMVGMSSASYFIKAFSSYYGITPKQFSSYYKKR